MSLLGIEPVASLDDGQDHSKVLRLENLLQVGVNLALVPQFELKQGWGNVKAYKAHIAKSWNGCL